MNDKGLLGFLNSLLKGIRPDRGQTYQFNKVSKHMRSNNIRATKAYTDDRQKAPRNRRKYGMRKRK